MLRDYTKIGIDVSVFFDPDDYEFDIGTNQPKPNREKEFALAVEHITLLNELLDLLEE